MRLKGERFEFYFPEMTALDLLKGILAFADRGKNYSCNPVKYNLFFQKAAKIFPDLFADIPFEEDSFLPYSEDIEKAYTAALEFNILSRPNPDIYPCRISASAERLERALEKFSSEDIQKFKKLAKHFETELQE